MKMKTQVFIMAIVIVMTGTFIAGCESPSQRKAEADANVQEAQQDLREAQQNATLASKKMATSEEWRVYKIDIDDRIMKNENRIAELRIQSKKPGNTHDDNYIKRIDLLEEQNKELKTRMVTFERNQSDWESFKREFNHDMNELGKALNDLTVNNKN